MIFALGLLVGAVGFDGGAAPVAPETVTEPDRAALGPGPARIVDGVGVGYARTEAGAITAATEYVTALSGPAALDEERVRRVLELIAAPDALARLTDAYEEVAALGRERLGLDQRPEPTVIFRADAVGYRVERFSEEEATIAVWTVGLTGSSATTAPRHSWSTTVAQLRWVEDDWKVEGLNTSPGPTPPLSGAPTASDELFTVVPEFEEYSYPQRP